MRKSATSDNRVKVGPTCCTADIVINFVPDRFEVGFAFDEVQLLNFYSAKGFECRSGRTAAKSTVAVRGILEIVRYVKNHGLTGTSSNQVRNHISCAASQTLPSGSANAAVRRPHGWSVGPFKIATPWAFNSLQTESKSATLMVKSARSGLPGEATSSGFTSSAASEDNSTLIISGPNFMTEDTPSSKTTGHPNTLE